MNDAKLADIEREVAVGWTLPGRADAYALTTITELVAEVRRLRQIIQEYARHNEGCSAAFGDEYRCRCGWRDVAPELREK